MDILCVGADIEDIPCICQQCKQLIDHYENLEKINYARVLDWVHQKIESSIHEYTTILVNGKKAGCYHFFKNEEDEFELDDLYIFPEFQNKGIGSTVIQTCCASVDAPVMLYVFIRNHRAVSLYQRLGFEIVQTIQDSRYIMRNHNPSVRRDP